MEILLCLGDCKFEETAIRDALLDVRLVFVIIDAHYFSLCCSVAQSCCEVELVAKKMRARSWPICEENETSSKEGKWRCWQFIAQDLHGTADEILHIFGLHCSSLGID